MDFWEARLHIRYPLRRGRFVHDFRNHRFYTTFKGMVDYINTAGQKIARETLEGNRHGSHGFSACFQVVLSRGPACLASREMVYQTIASHISPILSSCPCSVHLYLIDTTAVSDLSLMIDSGLCLQCSSWSTRSSVINPLRYVTSACLVDNNSLVQLRAHVLAPRTFLTKYSSKDGVSVIGNTLPYYRLQDCIMTFASSTMSTLTFSSTGSLTPLAAITYRLDRRAPKNQ